MNNKKKRVTLKLRHPNFLFETWLNEWKNEAKEKDSKLQHCFAKALQSLKKYPLPLERGRDCKILNGFGDKLCAMLDKKLLEYHQGFSNLNIIDATNNLHATTKRKLKVTGPSISKHARKEYVPTYRSGAYAIMIALYQYNVSGACSLGLTKSDVITKAKFLCDKSFTRPDPGSYYTAWSSMRTLINNGLVRKEGSPPRFFLTDIGITAAKQLCESNVDLQTNKIEEKSNERIVTANFDKNLIDQLKTNKLSNNINYINTNSQDSVNGGPACDTMLFEPHTFEILLVVDKQETSGSKEKIENDPILSELTYLNVPFVVKHLTVGDYMWICRNKSTNSELVLPYIIERKRMDDFGSSIKDGRYYEQKFRLKQCGIQNVIYLIESYGDNSHIGLPLSTLCQAATNTLIQEGFIVKFSEGTRGTAQYLGCLTKILKENYESKTLMNCCKANLQKSSFQDDLISLMTFQEFTQSGSKHKNFTATEMFIKQLVQLKGMSIDKACAIVEKYPTVKLFKMSCDTNFEDTEKIVANVQFGKKKRIGPVIGSTLCKFYTLKHFQ